MAMQDCGVFHPQKSAAEEAWLEEEDMRGVESFIDWIRGRENKEMMRIAGLGRAHEGPEGRIVAQVEEKEDFLTGSLSLSYMDSRTLLIVS